MVNYGVGQNPVFFGFGIDNGSIVEAYTKRRLLRDFGNSPPTGTPHNDDCA